MQITIQNKREDLEAFYDYVVMETQKGKAVNKQALRTQQMSVIIVTIFVGAYIHNWAGSENWAFTFIMIILCIIFLEMIILVKASFKPRYYYGKQVYRQQEKNLTSKDIQVFSLARKVTADTDWLEISNSEAVHRWRWGLINEIGLSTNFIFIQAGNCHHIQIPKRDFSSEASFIEFGKKLVELYEQKKDQPVAVE